MNPSPATPTPGLPRHTRIAGTGSMLPPRRLTNADLQLITAAIVWAYAEHASAAGLTPEKVARIVSLSGGALLANLVSVTILVAETLMQRR